MHLVSVSRVSIAAALACAALGLAPRASQAQLVQNGNFSTNGGVGQVTSGVTTLANWTVGPVIVNGITPLGTIPFVFVVDSNADATGFPSVNSPPNIFLYGPNTPAGAEGGPVNNGFTGSTNGGAFLGVDGGYATATVSQLITGLTIGDEYTLSFEWAASQFTRFTGATQQNWEVTFGSDTVSTPTFNLPSKGFSGWMDFSATFTATSTSQTLSFLAQGTPGGLPPFLLLDGVTLTPNTVTAVPEASSLALGSLLGIGLVAGGLRTRARRAKARANAA